MAENTDERYIDSKLRTGPWSRIIEKNVDHYGNVRCVQWKESLVYLEDGMPTPIAFDDQVLAGIARKTAVTLRGVCSKCGKKGKQRRVGFGWQVHCSGCHGKFTLAREIDQLLNSMERPPAAAFDGRPAVWFCEKVHPHLRACIPAECWRKTQLSDGAIVQYMTRDDLREMIPWLKRLQLAMEGKLKVDAEAEVVKETA